MTVKHPPVFFTIAAVRHEPILALGGFIPEIQDKLRRKGFSGPTDTADITTNIRDQSRGEFKSFTIFNPERTEACTFNEEGIYAFHTSAYESRSALFASFRTGLEILHSVVTLKTVNRVGARMLDLIRPSDYGKQMADFVDPHLLGFNGLGCTKDWSRGPSSLDEKFFDGDAEVLAKFACIPDGFGIHADLFSVISRHLLLEFVTNSPGEVHGILDIDSGTQMSRTNTGREYDVERIMAELEDHKNRISRVFRATVKPEALAAWGV